MFDGDALDKLRAHFARVASDFRAERVEMKGERDHVHLLVNYPPKVPVANLMRSLKGVSSRMLRQERQDIARHYYRGMLWSPSHFVASCGRAPLEITRQYVEQQDRPE